jgi:hypothetical protein
MKSNINKLISKSQDFTQAYLCEIGYHWKKEGFKEYVASLGFKFEGGYWNTQTGAEFYVVSKDGDGYITFIGTNEQKEWKEPNFDWHMIKTPLGKVHQGFYIYYLSMKAEIGKYIPAFSKIYIQGHSLGGACATIAAREYILFNPTVATFGQPRVGNSTFVKKLSFIKRYRNNNDIVPHVPPHIPFWRPYKHSKNEWYIDSNGGIKKNPLNIVKLAADISGLFKGITKKGVEFTEDHYPQHYVNAIGLDIGYDLKLSTKRHSNWELIKGGK